MYANCRSGSQGFLHKKWTFDSQPPLARCPFCQSPPVDLQYRVGRTTDLAFSRLSHIRAGFENPLPCAASLTRLGIEVEALDFIALECGPSTDGLPLFSASLLAPHVSKYRVSVHGQQAGLSESGSKLPHSTAARDRIAPPSAER